MNKLEMKILKETIQQEATLDVINSKILSRALTLAQYVMPEFVENVSHVEFSEEQLNITFRNALKPNQCFRINCYDYYYAICIIPDNQMAEQIHVFSYEEVYEVINHLKLFYKCCHHVATLTDDFNPITYNYMNAVEIFIKKMAADNIVDYLVIGVTNQDTLNTKQEVGDWAYSEQDRIHMLLMATYKNPNILISGVAGKSEDIVEHIKTYYSYSSHLFDATAEIQKYWEYDVNPTDTIVRQILNESVLKGVDILDLKMLVESEIVEFLIAKHAYKGVWAAREQRLGKL